MKQGNWIEQLKKGMSSDDAEPDLRLQWIVDKPSPSDEEDVALFSFGWNLMAHSYVGRAMSDLEHIWGVFQSPIEKAMFLALIIAAEDSGVRIRFAVDGHEFGYLGSSPEVLVVEPQARLGMYHVDFLLTYTETFPDFDKCVKYKDGSEGPGCKDTVVHLIVECDGHDFHDRSKEQASRDRERDRELSKLGYPVFRYTGSDIWKKSVACAKEILDSLSDRAMEGW